MIRISMIWLKYHMSSIWTIMLMIATWLFENCTWEKRGINWNNSHNNHQKKKKIEYYFNWSDIPLMRTWATAIGYRKRGVMLVETILGARGNTPRKVAGVFYHPPDNNVDRIIFFEHSYGNFRNLFFFFVLMMLTRFQTATCCRMGSAVSETIFEIIIKMLIIIYV